MFNSFSVKIQFMILQSCTHLFFFFFFRAGAQEVATTSCWTVHALAHPLSHDKVSLRRQHRTQVLFLKSNLMSSFRRHATIAPRLTLIARWRHFFKLPLGCWYGCISLSHTHTQKTVEHPLGKWKGGISKMNFYLECKLGFKLINTAGHTVDMTLNCLFHNENQDGQSPA